MCGRYLLAEKPERIYKRYNISKENIAKQLKLDPMYNIAPGAITPVITRNSPNKLELMKWGLIPHWAKDPKIGYKMINARAETIADKPSFRGPFKKHRCLVPASGFYEWKKLENEKTKIPYLIKNKSDELLSFAGLYDVWRDAENKEFKTFTIITTAPNELMSPIHNRMPVLLEKEEEKAWLDSETIPEDLLKLLDPYPSALLEAYTVSQDVNNPRNQGVELLKMFEYL